MVHSHLPFLLLFFLSISFTFSFTFTFSFYLVFVFIVFSYNSPEWERFARQECYVQEDVEDWREFLLSYPSYSPLPLPLLLFLPSSLSFLFSPTPNGFFYFIKQQMEELLRLGWKRQEIFGIFGRNKRDQGGRLGTYVHPSLFLLLSILFSLFYFCLFSPL